MIGNKPGFSHPCFQNEEAKVARIHLPVARKCNIKCSFCNPASGDICAHGCVPGLTRTVLTPQEAVERVEAVCSRGIDLKIVGIAGPGEPLFNEETFQTLEKVRARFPNMHLCLSTNGLLLPRKVDEIVRLGVETLTVTVNSLSLPVAHKIYEHVQGRKDDESFKELLHCQMLGIEMAARRGLCVKVNSVLVPGENEDELPEIARRVSERGAYIHNVLPLIPRADTKARLAPDAATIRRVREDCGKHLCQFDRCRHCRADALIDGD
ncbi:MAG: radical SAM protein [Clostridia bacterium]|nr:radical SAM protein [Clostridia bacterium]